MASTLHSMSADWDLKTVPQLNISPTRSRANLAIWTQALANRIVFDTTVPNEGDILLTGAQYNENGGNSTVRARMKVIISTGTFHSPKILELSGIGDANILRSLGIDVVIDDPHVGENLQTYSYCTMAFEAQNQEGFHTMDDPMRQRALPPSRLQYHPVRDEIHLPSTNNILNPDEARDLVRQKAVAAHHYSGACSMVPRELGGVVDEQLRVYGCKNLRVCGFSVAPLMTQCNRQATVLAEHGAHIIKSSS
ncbi:hypothetical protein DL769_009801 [Monosporascus sp. CRB-8-3]|nr:hypothetical protein DL769_009801 [Monosporascus sp. CRB-8-3]